MNKRIISGTGLLLAACLFVASIILVNATVTRFRLDLTENNLFTLSQGTLNIIDSLQEPVTLDFYFSQKELTGFPAMLNYGIRVRDLLEEYAAHSNGKIELTVIDPEPFSEQEDTAVGYGLRGITVNAAGDRAYFGLVGTNSTDDEKTIPVFQSNKEAALEYDITKLVYGLANPEKPTVGIMSSLPLLGDKQNKLEPWVIVKGIQDFFEVEEISTHTDKINSDIDVLMIVHPKALKEPTLYAIDQYLLSGGKAIVFVDPLAEGDSTQPDPNNPMVMPDLDSDLDTLFKIWGIEVLKEKIAGDKNAAMRVQSRSPRGPQEVQYLPWLRLGKESFNKDDFSTSELNILNLGTAGIIKKQPDSQLDFTPLIQTTEQSMKMERDLIIFQRDPRVMLENFKSEEQKQTLVARISGTVATAFPEGPPSQVQESEGSKKDERFVPEGKVNIILVADTDILRDLFWVRNQNMFGVDIPQPIADNGNFLINSLDNLAGNTDLISLRTRGGYARPFEKVEAIRRKAEAEFREREQVLLAKLKETEDKIRKLQTEGAGNQVLLSAAQNEEIEKFSQVRLQTRKELRAVQHELKKNIEQLGNQLKFINIGLLPIIIIFMTLLLGLYKTNRRL